jgi:hypothetical protein
MLLGDIAIANFALTLRAQEGRVSQDDSANDIADLTRHHGRSHTSHRVPQENWGGKSEPSDEAQDVARVIVVSISMERCTRLAVPPGIRHHHIEFTFKRAGQRAPAGSVPG